MLGVVTLMVDDGGGDGDDGDGDVDGGCGGWLWL